MAAHDNAERLYAAIVAHFATHDQSPSQMELRATTGMTRNMVHRLIRRLDAAGRIRHTPGTQRSIQLVDTTAPDTATRARMAELEASLAEARRAIIKLTADNARLRRIVDREAHDAERMRERFEDRLEAGW